VPYATNAADGTRVYFEDEGGAGMPVVLYGGILDSVDLVRREPIPLALRELGGEFRLIYADHRGLGRSDKPHDVASYAMPLQAMDAVAILDELDIERAHFAGASYGGRLCFGIGEHAADRVLSLVAGGQQPYAIDPDGPLARVISGVLDKTRRQGAIAFVEALEEYWETRLPDDFRPGYLAQDGAAVAAASEAMLTQGAISRDLRAWSVPCLIYLGAGDADFFEQAQRAADEIPNAEFVGLEGLDHLGAHFMSERIVPAVLRTLRGASGRARST
jgi:pimeloyl-ACP methyl ester carboxylesterase